MITSISTSYHTTVYIIAAVTLGTMEQLSIVLPCQRIIDAIIVSQTVRALPIIGNKLAYVITTHTDNNTIVGPKVECHLCLSLGCQRNVLRSIIVVTGGLHMAHALIIKVCLNLTEMAAVVQDACQMAWQRME